MWSCAIKKVGIMQVTTCRQIPGDCCYLQSQEEIWDALLQTKTWLGVEERESRFLNRSLPCHKDTISTYLHTDIHRRYCKISNLHLQSCLSRYFVASFLTSCFYWLYEIIYFKQYLYPSFPLVVHSSVKVGHSTPGTRWWHELPACWEKTFHGNYRPFYKYMER